MLYTIPALGDLARD